MVPFFDLLGMEFRCLVVFYEDFENISLITPRDTRGNDRHCSAIVVCGSSGGFPCSQAGVLVKFALISRAHAKITTTTASVHGGARSAPPCTRAVIVLEFPWARELNANSSTMSAWLRGCRSLLPKKRIKKLVYVVLCVPAGLLLYSE